jgi:hypothetical protein
MQPAFAIETAIDRDPVIQTADALASMLNGDRAIDRETLRELMTASAGRSDADGGWTLRDAYDALELAQILFILGPRSPVDESDPHSTLRRLRNLARSLPTQSHRAEEQVAL